MDWHLGERAPPVPKRDPLIATQKGQNAQNALNVRAKKTLLFRSLILRALRILLPSAFKSSPCLNGRDAYAPR